METIPIGELKAAPRPHRIFLEDACLIIVPKISNPNFCYGIERHRIKTARQILAWVHHLSSKNWATRDLLRDFIEVAGKEAGVKVWL